MSSTADIANDFLLEECRRNNRMAQQKVFNLYQSAMMGSAARITGNTMDAQDIVQESFFDAFTKIEMLESNRSFGAWLKRIVINKSLNMVKKKKLEVVDIDDNMHQLNAEIDQEEPEYTVDMVKEAMTQLADGYRLVFSLFAFEGYSHAQIAEEMGITESTSKSQYNRAKKRIKEIVINKVGHGQVG